VEDDEAPGKSEPETIALGDFYSEETRDVICCMQLPAVTDENPEFPIATVTLEYCNVASNETEKVTCVCSVKRSLKAEKNQKRDFELDKQINRLTAAAAMEDAQQVGLSDLNKARQIIKDAISSIEKSISAGDAFSASLIADLEDILSDMKNRTSYQQVAAKKMVWKGDAHTKQRAIGSAGESYQTKPKAKMQTKAKNYADEKSKSKSKERKNSE